MMSIRKTGSSSAICDKGEFRLQKGKESGLLRYPPTTACPWTTDREYDWVPVEGKGAVHSYAEVHHAIQPAFKGHTPYMMLLVDLDTQKGAPSEHEALRVAGNLLTADGEFAPPEMIKIGRHRHTGPHGLQTCDRRLQPAALGDR